MRTVLVGLVATVVWAGILLGLLAIRALDYSEMSVRELALVVGLAVLGPIAMTIARLLPGRAPPALAALLNGLGFRGARNDAVESTHEGIRILVHQGQFEDAHGKRRPAWIVDASISAPTWPDAALQRSLDERLGSGALIGFRSGGDTPGARIILERPLPQPIALRRAVLVLRDLGHRRPLRVEAHEPSLPESVSVSALGKAAVPIRWFLALGILASSIAALVLLTPHTTGYERFVLERANECALATTALGAPIKRTQIGVEWSSKSNRQINSTMLVLGPRGAARIDIESYQRTRGTHWTRFPIPSAVLDPGDGKTIELFSCARSWKGGVPNIAQTSSFKGKVSSVSGRAPVSVGNACTMQASPSGGVAAQCRVVVECGGRALYGTKPDLGFTDCWTVLDNGAPSFVARDLDRKGDGPPRAEASLDLDERKKRVTIGEPTWKVDIAW